LYFRQLCNCRGIVFVDALVCTNVVRGKEKKIQRYINGYNRYCFLTYE
jgi:hypothetical protein